MITLLSARISLWRTYYNGTENRIAVARQNYNEAVKTFNTYVRRFPKNIVAAICGFDKKSYFEADAAAAQAPEVQF